MNYAAAVMHRAIAVMYRATAVHCTVLLLWYELVLLLLLLLLCSVPCCCCATAVYEAALSAGSTTQQLAQEVCGLSAHGKISHKTATTRPPKAIPAAATLLGLVSSEQTATLRLRPPASALAL